MKKLKQSVQRCEEDEEMQQADHTESDDDEQQGIYNPLNWSMGCDGKPIE